MGFFRRLVASVRELFARKPRAHEAKRLSGGAPRTIEGMPADLLRGGISPELLVRAKGAAGDSLAPWPSIDRYPIIQGQALSLQSLASAYRTALSGYRYTYVDILDELLEREPTGFAVLSQRILVVAGGRVEITPAVRSDHPRYERACEAAELVERQLSNLPDRRQNFASLLWSLYYGPCGSEIHWDRRNGEWTAARLTFIHSRRLNYPDPNAWDIYVVDQGAPWVTPAPNLTGTWGIRISDYPHKFIVHSPQLRGDYPTREGLGRELGDWFCLKRLAARGAGQYLERFAKPWAFAQYNTAEPGVPNGGPRAADEKDIESAQAAMNALGVGSLASWVGPDSIKVNISTPDGTGGGSKLSYLEFLAYVDNQITKCVRGNTFTTEPGKFGSKGAGQTGRDGELDIARYDASCFAETLRRDLATPIVRLNMPDAADLIPVVTIHVEDDPSPQAIMDLAFKAASVGMPVDADKLADKIDLELIPVADPNAKETDPKPRRIALVKQVDLSAIDSSVKAPPAPTPPTAPIDETNPEGSDDSEEEEPAEDDSTSASVN